MPFLLLVLLLLSGLGRAHPFGSELYGHKLEVRLDRGQVQVDYLAEISTTDHLRDLRAWLRGQPDPSAADEARYLALVSEELRSGLSVLADGQPVALRPLPVDEPDGRGDSRFVAFRLSMTGELPPQARQLNVINQNLPDKPGLYNTRLLVSDAVVVDACSLFPVEDGRLLEDRSTRWLGDRDGRELRVAYRVRTGAGEAVQRGFRRLAATGPVDAYSDGRARLSTVEQDPLLELIRGEPGPTSVLLGLLTAVVLGALHGLSPGHGKALVAAWLVGQRRSPWQAVWLGLIVTATHTISVYALGLVALVLAESFAPEKVLPWLELASGALVVIVGLGLLRSRWRVARAGAGSPASPPGGGDASDPPHSHAHSHSHSHDHGHDHGHSHDHGHAHDHALLDEQAHARAHAQDLARTGEGMRGLIALGVSGGLAPCPSALVLLLTAIGLQRIGLGLVLVFAFSVGLALLVTGLGLLVLALGDRLRDARPTAGVTRLLPVFSAVAVTVLGGALTWKGVQSVLAALGGA